jgi:hypothetical protein
MDTSSCPFLISPEVSVPPGTVVCMSAGVVAEMDGMIVGELEFSTFALLSMEYYIQQPLRTLQQ